MLFTIIYLNILFTLGIRAPAAIPRTINITARINKRTVMGYKTQINMKERPCMHTMIAYLDHTVAGFSNEK